MARTETRSQRDVPVWLLIAALVLVGVRIAMTFAAPKPDGETRVSWVALDGVGAASAASDRLIMLDFTAEWCQPCHQLDAEVFSDPQLAARINERFIAVRVVDRKQEEGQNLPAVDRLQERYAVQGFPTVVFVDRNGNERARMEGFRGRAEFERVMNSVLERTPQ